MAPFRYESSVDPRQSDTIAALMLRRGDIAAHAVQQNGAVWNGAIQNVGQMIGALPGQIALGKRAQLQDQIGAEQLQDMRANAADRLKQSAANDEARHLALTSQIGLALHDRLRPDDPTNNLQAMQEALNTAEQHRLITSEQAQQFGAMASADPTKIPEVAKSWAGLTAAGRAEIEKTITNKPGEVTTSRWDGKPVGTPIPEKKKYELKPVMLDGQPAELGYDPETNSFAPPTAPPPALDRGQWGKREDGSAKGDGFLGPLKRPDGKVSSEISIGVMIDGKETEIPTLVPTLTPAERNWLLTNDVSDPSKIPMSIQQKAIDFAKPRIAAGKSPFAGPDESPVSQGADLSGRVTPYAKDAQRTESDKALDAYAKSIGKTKAEDLTYPERQAFDKNKAAITASAEFQKHINERNYDNAHPAPVKDADQGKLEQQYRTVLARAMSSRSGGIGAEDAKVQQANHLLSLLHQTYDPKTDSYSIPKTLQGELAAGLARLVAPGGNVGIEMMREFDQRTAKGDIAGALSYVTGHPFPTATQDFAKLLKDSIERQGNVAQENREGEMRYLRGLAPTELEESRRQALEANTLNPLRQSRVIQNTTSGERKLQVSVDGGKTWK